MPTTWLHAIALRSTAATLASARSDAATSSSSSGAATRRRAARSVGDTPTTRARPGATWGARCRSEEHTSELQSRPHLVCRLLLEKKKDARYVHRATIRSHASHERRSRTHTNHRG